MIRFHRIDIKISIIIIALCLSHLNFEKKKIPTHRENTRQECEWQLNWSLKMKISWRHRPVKRLILSCNL